MENIETKLNGKSRQVVIIGDISLIEHAIEKGLPITVYRTEEDYHKRQVEDTSLGDFTRKSVVGAGYRVGASFTLDAIYLTAAGALAYYAAKKAGLEESITHSASDFVKNLDPWKLARVAAAVVAINFADYKWDITNRLDNGAKWLSKKTKSLINRRK